MADRAAAIEVSAGFRQRFYQCITRRTDVLFELADALLCADGPVKTLVGLTLVPEHRRGHGAMYDALNQGRIDVAALRRELAGLPLPRHGSTTPRAVGPPNTAGSSSSATLPPGAPRTRSP